MTSSQARTKLLICTVGRHRGEKIVDITKAAGARGGTVALGKTLGNSRLLQAFALADVPQDIVFTLMNKEADHVVAAVKAAAAVSSKLEGIAILLDVSDMFIRGVKQQPTDEGSTPMESGYKLITIIVNHGHAEDVMTAARKAGATGGTILTARGTGTEEDVKFFGVSLVPEKEMLTIVASKDNFDAIVEAVGKLPELCKPGGGIVYSMNVEQFIVLGKE